MSAASPDFVYEMSCANPGSYEQLVPDLDKERSAREALREGRQEDPKGEAHDLAVSALHKHLGESAFVVPSIEEETIYGLVVVIPQLARSAGWSGTMVIAAIRTSALFVLTLFLQGLLLYMVNKEQIVMNRYSGQMFLCDFGAFRTDCSDDGSDCLGPYGTRVTSAGRMYSFGDLVTRTFVRDSLLALFPDRKHDISEKIDPGEWGVTDYWCRLACVFIFTLSITDELLNIFRLFLVLCSVPTRADDWMSYDPECGNEDGLVVKVSGMPLSWKVINTILVLVPKAFIFKATAEAGTTFLLESAGISGVITNAVALDFVFSIPEVVFSALTLHSEKLLLEGIRQVHSDASAKMSRSELIHRHRDGKLECKGWIYVLNRRLCLAIGLCAFQVCFYYQRFCTQTENGEWISKPQSLPKDERYSFLTAFLPRFFPEEVQDEPYWSPPEK